MLKRIILFTTVFFMFSCNSFERQDSFYTRKRGVDYYRIPLPKKTELIQLDGSENWVFSLDKNKIDSPNISALINVRKLGINDTTFVLISENFNYNGIDFNGVAIKVTGNDKQKHISVYENANEIDSIFLDKKTYTWYYVNNVWDRFNTNGILPWYK